jgi:protein involved in polysaccharide export with SLBB domain
MRLNFTKAISAVKATLAAGAMLVLAACAGGATPTGAAPEPTVGAVQGEAASFNPLDYRLGNGDEVRVIVFGENELSGTFKVDGSGFIALPLVGNMDVKGKTLREFEEALSAKLKEGYMTEPKVSAEVANFRPFYILGEVQQPGTYPFTSGLTVQNAVATARGYTYRADQRRVYIKHQGDVKETETRITTTTPVLPGDTIRVPERLF